VIGVHHCGNKSVAVAFIKSSRVKPQLVGILLIRNLCFLQSFVVSSPKNVIGWLELFCRQKDPRTKEFLSKNDLKAILLAFLSHVNHRNVVKRVKYAHSR
jgi:hypothetical protein